MYCINRCPDGEVLPVIGRADILISKGAKLIEKPNPKQIPFGLIAVIKASMDICAYVPNERCYYDVLAECRQVTWLTHPYAKELSSYVDFEKRDKSPIVDVFFHVPIENKND